MIRTALYDSAKREERMSKLARDSVEELVRSRSLHRWWFERVMKKKG